MALIDIEEIAEEAIRQLREGIPASENYRLHDHLWQDGLLRRLLPPMKMESTKDLKEAVKVTPEKRGIGG